MHERSSRGLRLSVPAVSARVSKESVASTLARLIASREAVTRADLVRVTGLARSTVTAGLEMLQEVRGPGRITVAGDKGYDTAAFVASCRALNVTPHVAQNERRPCGSALDLRTTSWPGYAVSQRVRKRVEEIFGWIKTVGNFRRTRYRGVQRTSFAAYLVGAAYNLLRIAKLCPSG